MSTDADFLFVTRKWAPAMGGMETWSLKLAEGLAKLQAIDLVALPGRRNGMPASVLGLLLFPLTVFRRYWSRKSTPSTLLLGDMAIWPLALPLVFRSKATTVLIAAHGTDVSYHRRGGVKGRLYGAYLRLGSRLLSRARIIANSQATAQVASETGWRNSAVIPLGTQHFPTPKNNEHNGHILFAGRLVHRKGCGWFTREVLPHLPADIRLQIAGTGWDASEAHVIDDPRVDYLGCLEPDQLALAYSKALCVIVPNIEPENGEYEGFGLVAPEAAAAGGIVLAADHGGLRDAVIDGETGHLLACGEASAWVDAIDGVAKLSPNARSEFCHEAQAAAREHFSWDRVAPAVLSLAGTKQ
ncbi:glycosyltransferase family 4 protein [Pontixanthobacter sp. CEM42]|uniref:glycosyltransferase family 4 protein n=1 Tax=Pontixanthobacter sp. CEM42 TaxID=2792077 RepID=UPI001AE0D10D|nr:glycosyltransferase family 4 protein [Pontixanthobacter sp. CEM42]